MTGSPNREPPQPLEYTTSASITWCREARRGGQAEAGPLWEISSLAPPLLASLPLSPECSTGSPSKEGMIPESQKGTCCSSLRPGEGPHTQSGVPQPPQIWTTEPCEAETSPSDVLACTVFVPPLLATPRLSWGACSFSAAPPAQPGPGSPDRRHPPLCSLVPYLRLRPLTPRVPWPPH